jgi:hypothetical protein
VAPLDFEIAGAVFDLLAKLAKRVADFTNASALLGV